ncbi:MAG: type II toxin-antitoxin system HicB family antitoxin [Streptosporangiaceae bacterium]
MTRPERLTIGVHREPGGGLWADVKELPGCFASGRDMAELSEALDEAVSLYLSEPGHPVSIQLEVTQEQVLVRSA